MLKAKPIALRDQLWRIHHKANHKAPEPGRVSLRMADGVPKSYYRAVGYQPIGQMAVRVDILERISAGLRRSARRGPFRPDPTLHALSGVQQKDFNSILESLGYCLLTSGAALESDIDPEKHSLYVQTAKSGKRKNKKLKKKKLNRPSFPNTSASHFAALQSLSLTNK